MTTISILVVSDIICPWCYIGYKELKLAIDRTCEAHPDAKFELEYRPFLLDPSLSCKTPVDKKEHMVGKFGETRYNNACRILGDRGKELGITFKWNGKLRQTVSAHRLLFYAYQQDPALQEVLLGCIFRAYFEEEKDVGDYEVLGALAEEAGVMSKAEAIELLSADKLMKQIQILMVDAQKKGITGVPFTVINQKYAVSGAQKSDAYAEVFEGLITRGNDLYEAQVLATLASMNRQVFACS